MKFAEVPTQFIEQNLTTGQKTNIIVKYHIKESCTNEKNKQKAFRKLSNEGIDIESEKVFLSVYSIQKYYYSNT